MDDLIYLQNEAFEFSIEINPHAGVHEKVENYFDEDDLEDWISPEQRDQAVASQKCVRGQIYPNGSVSFFTVLGVDVLEVVRKCAELCREDRARWAAVN